MHNVHLRKLSHALLIAVLICIECNVSSKTRNLKMSVIELTYASLTILLDNTTQSIKITLKHRFFHNHITIETV